MCRIFGHLNAVLLVSSGRGHCGNAFDPVKAYLLLCDACYMCAVTFKVKIFGSFVVSR